MGILNCCQYEYNSNHQEIISLGKAIERDRLKAIKYANTSAITKEHQNSISDFFFSDNTTTKATSSLKPIPSETKLSSDSFGHLNLYPISIASSLIDEINFLRTNPLAFAKKIQTYTEMIQHSNCQGYYITINSSTILLSKGKEPFTKAVEYLNTVQPLNALECDSDLVIHVSCDGGLVDDEVVEKEIALLKEKKSGKYKEMGWIKDKNVSNAEFVAVYNFVDLYSEQGWKRKMMLNEKATKIGVSCFKMDDNGVFCYIIMFGIE